MEEDLRAKETFIADVDGDRGVLGVLRGVLDVEPLGGIAVVLHKLRAHVLANVAVAGGGERRMLRG